MSTPLQWEGLQRYRSETGSSTADTSTTSEYAQVSQVVDCKTLDFMYFSNTQDGTRGCDMDAQDAIINYGPWTQRQRNILQGFFSPQAYRDRPPPPPASADADNTSFPINITFLGKSVLRIPTREPSQDEDFRDASAPQTAFPEAKPNSSPRPYGWIEVQFAPNSLMTMRLPSAPGPNGYQTAFGITFLNAIVTTSVNHRPFILGKKIMIELMQAAPLSWNGLREWEIKCTFADCDLYLLRNHITLIMDIVKDLNSLPPPSIEYFVPSVYEISFEFVNLKTWFNLNPMNVIRRHNDPDENEYLILTTQRGSLAVSLSFENFQPDHRIVEISGNLLDLVLTSSFPARHELKMFLKSPFNNLLLTSSLGINGTYVYRQVVPGNRDVLSLEFESNPSHVNAHGHLLPTVLSLLRNYFGDASRFMSPEAYQLGKFPKPIKTDDKNPFELHFMWIARGVSIVLPCTMYGSADNVTLRTNNIQLDLRNKVDGQDIHVTFSPLTAVWDESSLTVRDLQLHIQRFHTGQPNYALLLASWNIHVGEILGDIHPKSVGKLSDAAQSFAYHMNNAHPMVRKFVESRTDARSCNVMECTVRKVEVCAHLDNVMTRVLLPNGLFGHRNNCVFEKGNHTVFLHVPLLVISSLHVPDAKQSRGVRRDYGAEVFRLETSVILDNKRAFDDADQQARDQYEFLQAGDAATGGRLWALLNRAGIGKFSAPSVPPTFFLRMPLFFQSGMVEHPPETAPDLHSEPANLLGRAPASMADIPYADHLSLFDIEGHSTASATAAPSSQSRQPAAVRLVKRPDTQPLSLPKEATSYKVESTVSAKPGENHWSVRFTRRTTVVLTPLSLRAAVRALQQMVSDQGSLSADDFERTLDIFQRRHRASMQASLPSFSFLHVYSILLSSLHVRLVSGLANGRRTTCIVDIVAQSMSGSAKMKEGAFVPGQIELHLGSFDCGMRVKETPQYEALQIPGLPPSTWSAHDVWHSVDDPVNIYLSVKDVNLTFEIGTSRRNILSVASVQIKAVDAIVDVLVMQIQLWRGYVLNVAKDFQALLRKPSNVMQQALSIVYIFQENSELSGIPGPAHFANLGLVDAGDDAGQLLVFLRTAWSIIRNSKRFAFVRSKAPELLSLGEGNLGTLCSNILRKWGHVPTNVYPAWFMRLLDPATYAAPIKAQQAPLPSGESRLIATISSAELMVFDESGEPNAITIKNIGLQPRVKTVLITLDNGAAVAMPTVVVELTVVAHVESIETRIYPKFITFVLASLKDRKQLMAALARPPQTQTQQAQPTQQQQQTQQQSQQQQQQQQQLSPLITFASPNAEGYFTLDRMNMDRPPASAAISMSDGASFAAATGVSSTINDSNRTVSFSGFLQVKHILAVIQERNVEARLQLDDVNICVQTGHNSNEIASPIPHPLAFSLYAGIGHTGLQLCERQAVLGAVQSDVILSLDVERARMHAGRTRWQSDEMSMLLVVDKVLVRLPRSLIKIQMFFDKLRAEDIPRYSSAFRDAAMPPAMPPVAAQLPAETRRFQAFQRMLDVFVGHIAVESDLLSNFRFSYELHDATMSVLLQGYSELLSRTIYLYRLNKQQLLFPATAGSSSLPLSGTHDAFQQRGLVPLPTSFGIGTIVHSRSDTMMPWNASFDGGIVLENIDAVLNIEVVDQLLTMYAVLASELNEVVRVLSFHSEQRRRMQRNDELLSRSQPARGTFKYSYKVTVKDISISADSPSNSVVVTSSVLNGFLTNRTPDSSKSALLWSLVADGLSLSLLQRSTSGYVQTLASLLIDLSVQNWKATPTESGAEDIEDMYDVTFWKVQALMQPVAIGKIADVTSFWQSALSRRNSLRKEELHEMRQSTRSVIDSIVSSLPEVATGSGSSGGSGSGSATPAGAGATAAAAAAAKLLSRPLRLTINSLAVMLPIMDDASLKHDWTRTAQMGPTGTSTGMAAADHADALLIHLASATVTRNGQESRAKISQLSVLFVSRFNPANERDFDPDNHFAQNRAALPQVLLTLTHTTGDDATRVKIDADIEGFTVELDASISEKMGLLMKVYQKGKKMVHAAMPVNADAETVSRLQAIGMTVGRLESALIDGSGSTVGSAPGVASRTGLGLSGVSSSRPLPANWNSGLYSSTGLAGSSGSASTGPGSGAWTGSRFGAGNASGPERAAGPAALPGVVFEVDGNFKFASGSILIRTIPQAAKAARFSRMQGSDATGGSVELDRLLIPGLTLLMRGVTTLGGEGPISGARLPKGLHLELVIHPSENVLNPSIVEFFGDLAANLSRHRQSAAAATAQRPSVKPLASIINSEVADQFEAAARDQWRAGYTGTVDYQQHSVTFLLRLMQTRINLSCQPYAKVVCALNLDKASLLFSFVPKNHITAGHRYLSCTASIQNARGSLRHIFSPEDCLRAEIPNLSFSATIDQTVGKGLALLTTVSVPQVSAHLNMRQMQDFFIFARLWFRRKPPQGTPPSNSKRNSAMSGGVGTRRSVSYMDGYVAALGVAGGGGGSRPETPVAGVAPQGLDAGAAGTGAGAEASSGPTASTDQPNYHALMYQDTFVIAAVIDKIDAVAEMGPSIGRASFALTSLNAGLDLARRGRSALSRLTHASVASVLISAEGRLTGSVSLERIKALATSIDPQDSPNGTTGTSASVTAERVEANLQYQNERILILEILPLALVVTDSWQEARLRLSIDGHIETVRFVMSKHAGPRCIQFFKRIASSVRDKAMAAKMQLASLSMLLPDGTLPSSQLFRNQQQQQQQQQQMSGEQGSLNPTLVTVTMEPRSVFQLPKFEGVVELTTRIRVDSCFGTTARNNFRDPDCAQVSLTRLEISLTEVPVHIETLAEKTIFAFERLAIKKSSLKAVSQAEERMWTSSQWLTFLNASAGSDVVQFPRVVMDLSSQSDLLRHQAEYSFRTDFGGRVYVALNIGLYKYLLDLVKSYIKAVSNLEQDGEAVDAAQQQLLKSGGPPGATAVATAAPRSFSPDIAHASGSPTLSIGGAGGTGSGGPSAWSSPPSSPTVPRPSAQRRSSIVRVTPRPKVMLLRTGELRFEPQLQVTGDATPTELVESLGLHKDNIPSMLYTYVTVGLSDFAHQTGKVYRIFAIRASEDGFVSPMESLPDGFDSHGHADGDDDEDGVHMVMAPYE
ncbi:hypothetical protein BC831DRAFT_283167 [Entophlyctis helioformis]|nr:hypothetical protein BC831DRAFT_283167 [Entophlyctis helioformis]